MARFSRMQVLNAVIESGLVPLFYNADFEVSKQVAAACEAGGARVLEFTNRGDFAIDVFTQLSKHLAEQNSQLILGIGSVVDAPTAAMYMAAGANFVVGPVLNPEVARVCNRHKVAYMPGCGTLSEISQAEELGVEIVKIFPGTSVGGPGFVKAVMGPCPWTRIMPTGGVDASEENLRAWFEAGATCVGMGSKLIEKSLVAAGDYAALTEKVALVLQRINAIRNSN
ncbi:MAG: bifunctional 4-hydroxy-2-oxoglutarate aldolase/2-dehydro-3-deoxy-phosphogluconate aldolase [Anaerolineales bacterium]|nr:bifunctional 4-hydroxy-2-oxoglutarate aldolase/2-dehydro-3-deoxy-phosphogluconate aldolase [Anaerolineales bacterium]